MLLVTPVLFPLRQAIGTFFQSCDVAFAQKHCVHAMYAMYVDLYNDEQYDVTQSTTTVLPLTHGLWGVHAVQAMSCTADSSPQGGAIEACSYCSSAAYMDLYLVYSFSKSRFMQQQ